MSHAPESVTGWDRHVVGMGRQGSMDSFGWKQLSNEEKQAVNKQEAEKGRQTREEMRKETERKKVAAEEHRHVKNALYQQKWHDTHPSSSTQAATVNQALNNSGASTLTISEAAALSRIGQKGEWKAERNGKHGGTKQEKHSRMSYYHPLVWALIAKWAPKVAWSPQALVNVLQRENPVMYRKLHQSTVTKWMDSSKKGWSEATVENVERRHALAGTG